MKTIKYTEISKTTLKTVSPLGDSITQQTNTEIFKTLSVSLFSTIPCCKRNVPAPHPRYITGSGILVIFYPPTALKIPLFTPRIIRLAIRFPIKMAGKTHLIRMLGVQILLPAAVKVRKRLHDITIISWL